MKTRIWIYILLTLIVGVSACLRFYRLDQLPVSVYWDGVATSYNAYSILKTGKDEYGASLPIVFRSFDDYKMPGNVYLTVVPIALFGLNEFSTRFTSAVAGTITTLIVFFLMRELFSVEEVESEKKFQFKKYRDKIALLCSFLFAIAPWSIQFSRMEFEANVGTVFVISGVILFLKSMRLKKSIFLFLSMILFAISVYFYRSIVIFTPLLLICLLMIFKKEVLRIKKITILALLIFCVVSFPMFKALTTSNGSIRANQVSIVNNVQQEIFTAATLQQKNNSTIISKIIYNRRIIYAETFIKGYFSNFSWSFLFTKGDPQGRHSTKGMGMLYLWEFPFILFGMYILFFKLPRKLRFIIISWIIIAPLPAAIAVPNPHALRTLNILPMFQVLSALGIFELAVVLKGKLRFTFISILSVCIVISLMHYLYLYYGSSARLTSSDVADGYKQLVQYVLPREKDYQKIVISGHYWKPYVYVLYYKQYDPLLYQKYGHWYGFDKYLFGGTSWGQNEQELDYVDLKKFSGANTVLVALSPDEYQHQKPNVVVLERIYNHNNELVFIVGRTQ